MNTKKILVIAGPASTCSDPSTWYGLPKTFLTSFADTDEKAIEMAHTDQYDMALVDDSETTDFKKLAAILPILQSGIEMISYKGERADELETKILSAFTERRNERIKHFLILDASDSYDRPFFSAN